MAAKSTLFILSVSEKDMSSSADPEVKYTGPGRIAPYASVADSLDWYFTSKIQDCWNSLCVLTGPKLAADFRTSLVLNVGKTCPRA